MVRTCSGDAAVREHIVQNWMAKLFTFRWQFTEGVTTENYLCKTNPRNPNIMDILREIGLAEKAGSGFDKIFTDLLKKG